MILRKTDVLGEAMSIRHLAVSLLLFCFVLQGEDPDPTLRHSGPGDKQSLPASEGKGVRALKNKAGADARDWPTYNCDVLGSRHNTGETALSRAEVARLEEKWRFPPRGADLEIGAVHATPVVVNGYVYFGTVNRSAFYKLTPDGKVMFLAPMGEQVPAVIAKLDGKEARAIGPDLKPLDTDELRKRLQGWTAVVAVQAEFAVPDAFFLKVLNQNSVIFVLPKRCSRRWQRPPNRAGHRRNHCRDDSPRAIQ